MDLMTGMVDVDSIPDRGLRVPLMSCWGWSWVSVILSRTECACAGVVSGVRMLVCEAYDVMKQIVTRLGKDAEVWIAGWLDVPRHGMR